MEVTAIMPVYNASRYLHDSIGSILKQTNSNWKLICIDDGSTDGSCEIINQYCQNDSRINLIVQKNAGPGVARARAIEIVQTEYIAILDSDDAWAPNYVELMTSYAKETDADIIVPNVDFNYTTPDEGKNVFQLDKYCPLVITDSKDAFSRTIPWKLHGWNMIRTSLAKEYYTIQAASYSKFNSDEYITRLLYLKGHKTVLCPAVYLYRQSSDSITRKPSFKKMDYLITLERLLWLCKYENLNKEIICNIYNIYYQTVKDIKGHLIPLLAPENQVQAKEVLNRSIEHFKSYFKWANISGTTLRTRLKFCLFVYATELFSKKVFKNLYYSLIRNKRIYSIKNKDVSIISNNCWGGFIYQSCGLSYNSPFIGLYMYAPEYVAMLRNLKENLKQPIRFISHDESKYKDIVPAQYLLGVLGNTGIEIVFMHYNLKEEVLEKWNRRLKRINWDNMIVKFSDTDYGCTDKLIEEFDRMPFCNKVCFTARSHPDCHCVIPMNEYKDKPYVLYEWTYSNKYFNFVEKANKIIHGKAKKQ